MVNFTYPISQGYLVCKYEIFGKRVSNRLQIDLSEIESQHEIDFNIISMQFCVDIVVTLGIKRSTTSSRTFFWALKNLGSPIKLESIYIEFMGIAKSITYVDLNGNINKYSAGFGAFLKLSGGFGIFGPNDNGTLISSPDDSVLIEFLNRRRLRLHLDSWINHPGLTANDLGQRLIDSRRTLTGVFEGSFHIACGVKANGIPRIRFSFGAIRASLIWTDHGCFTSSRIYEAILMGEEGKTCGSNGRGILAKRLQITMSLFGNPGQQSIDSLSRFLAGPVASAFETPHFTQILLDSSANGVEIVPHSISPNALDPKETHILSLKFRQLFNSVGWIDHVWYKNGLLTSHSAPESLSVHGLNSESPYFIRDFLESGKYIHSWLPYFEENCRPVELQFRRKRRWITIVITAFPLSIAFVSRVTSYIFRLSRRFFSKIIKFFERFHTTKTLFERRESHIPIVYLPNFADPRTGRRLMWQSVKDYRVFHYSAGAVFNPSNNLDSFLRNVDSLIENGGVSVCHSYLAYASDQNSTWQVSPNGNIEITEEFDNLLAQISNLRDEGKIEILPASILLSRWLERRDISLFHDVDSTQIVNNSIDKSCVVTIVCDTKVSIINSRTTPQFSSNGMEYFYTFRIFPREEVTLRLLTPDY